MSSFTFLGREYNTNEFLKDVVSLAKLLATNARLIDPLTANVDFSEEQQKEVQDQVLYALSITSDPNNRFFLSVTTADRRNDGASAVRNRRLLVCFHSVPHHPAVFVSPRPIARYPAQNTLHPNPDPFPPPRPKRRALLPQIP